MDESTKKIIGKIVNSIKIFFLVFMVPSMIIILILLGSIQARYSYESNLSTSLNYSLGQVGSAFYQIYSIGSKDTKWLYYSLIILIGLLIETIYEIFSLFKVDDSKRLSEGAEGEGVGEVDKSKDVDEDSNIVKGGNKVI